MNHQRVELGITLRQWEHDPAAVWLLWRDLVADGVGHDLLQRHRTRRGKHHQRHSGAEHEVQTPADPVVGTLGAWNDTVEFRREIRQVVDFETWAVGPQPR